MAKLKTTALFIWTISTAFKVMGLTLFWQKVPLLDSSYS
jgi:hypothetical protein